MHDLNPYKNVTFITPFLQGETPLSDVLDMGAEQWVTQNNIDLSKELLCNIPELSRRWPSIHELERALTYVRTVDENLETLPDDFVEDYASYVESEMSILWNDQFTMLMANDEARYLGRYNTKYIVTDSGIVDLWNTEGFGFFTIYGGADIYTVTSSDGSIHCFVTDDCYLDSRDRLSEHLTSIKELSEIEDDSISLIESVLYDFKDNIEREVTPPFLPKSAPRDSLVQWIVDSLDGCTCLYAAYSPDQLHRIVMDMINRRDDGSILIHYSGMFKLVSILLDNNTHRSGRIYYKVYVFPNSFIDRVYPLLDYFL